MAATIGLVLDCADPHDLAEFCTSALGYRNAGSEVEDRQAVACSDGAERNEA
jgi:hypothetical protein